jgi:hypothetical protein
MPRMTGKDEPIEVQVTLANGKVLDFKKNLGDTIGMQNIDTQIGKGHGATPHHYYTLTLVEGQKEEV